MGGPTGGLHVVSPRAPMVETVPSFGLVRRLDGGEWRKQAPPPSENGAQPGRQVPILTERTVEKCAGRNVVLARLAVGVGYPRGAKTQTSPTFLRPSRWKPEQSGETLLFKMLVVRKCLCDLLLVHHLH